MKITKKQQEFVKRNKHILNQLLQNRIEELKEEVLSVKGEKRGKRILLANELKALKNTITQISTEDEGDKDSFV